MARKRPLGQGYGSPSPADGERATSNDDARQTDFPGSEPGRVHGHDGLSTRQERTCQADQRGTDHGLLSSGPCHHRRIRRKHDRPEPACSAGKARARVAEVTRCATSRQSTA